MSIYLLSLLLTTPSVLVPGTHDKVKKASFEVLIDNHLSGSGSLVDPSGIGLVAAHTVMGRTRMEIRSRTLGRLDVQVLAIDAGHDLALVRLPSRKDPYPFLSVATKAPGVGDTVFLFGAPLYRHELLLRGSVARAEASFEYLPDMKYYVRVTHIAGPAPPGSSGGPWFNAQGELVGVQSGLMHEGGSPVGIAYMAPHEAVVSLIQNQVNRPVPSLGIGFEELWEQPAKFVRRYPQRQEGLVAAKVAVDGSGYRAGLRNGDLVIQVERRPVSYRDDLLQIVRSRKPGDLIKLTLRDPNGRERTVSVTLGTLKKASYSRR